MAEAATANDDKGKGKNGNHRLFLLDGMALIYRAHFALIRSPLYTSHGVNASAVFGFTNALLDLIEKPAADDPKLALLRRDREQLKQSLIEEAKARGERPLPPMIDGQILAVERQEAALRAVEAVEAAAYAATGEPLDKAGAYALQGEGKGFVAEVEGLRSTVIGLPLEHIVDLLIRNGIMPTRP